MHEGNKNNTAVPTPNLEQIIRNASSGKEQTEPINSPVRIHVHSLRKRSTDFDGISIKAAADGLIHAGILRDDSPEYVTSGTYSQEVSPREETIITITLDEQAHG